MMVPFDLPLEMFVWLFAHKYGHIALGHPLDANNELIFQKNSVYEAYANTFANELILPEKLFLQKQQEFSDDNLKISSFFCMAPAAIILKKCTLEGSELNIHESSTRLRP